MSFAPGSSSIVGQSTPSNVCRRPSTSEVLSTFEKLCAQATTDKVQSWTGKTLEKALGWAGLADRAKQWPEGEQPRQRFLYALVTNPFIPQPLRELCEQKILELPKGEAILSAAQNGNVRRLSLVDTQFSKRLRRCNFSELELVKRVAVRETVERCLNRPELQTRLLTQAESKHPWSLELVLRLAARGEQWALHRIPSLCTAIKTELQPEVIDNACAQNITLRDFLK